MVYECGSMSMKWLFIDRFSYESTRKSCQKNRVECMTRWRLGVCANSLLYSVFGYSTFLTTLLWLLLDGSLTGQNTIILNLIPKHKSMMRHPGWWGFSMESFRKAAYRQYVLWRFGKLGRGNRRVLPSCVVRTRRAAYPAPDSRYMGFRANWLLYICYIF